MGEYSSAGMSPYRVRTVIRSGTATGFVANCTFGDSSNNRLMTGNAAWKVRASNAGRQAMAGSLNGIDASSYLKTIGSSGYLTARR
jgi:hypothetical protein